MLIYIFDNNNEKLLQSKNGKLFIRIIKIEEKYRLINQLLPETRQPTL
jgi:hypothetical protein